VIDLFDELWITAAVAAFGFDGLDWIRRLEVGVDDDLFLALVLGLLGGEFGVVLALDDV